MTSLAPTAEQNPNVAAFVARWQKEKGRAANGLPYTQYFYDVPYVIAGIVHHLHEKNLPMTGETMRQALIEVRTFDGPMTGPVTFNADHTVDKPVYVWRVKDGRFQYRDKDRRLNGGVRSIHPGAVGLDGLCQCQLYLPVRDLPVAGA